MSFGRFGEDLGLHFGGYGAGLGSHVGGFGAGFGLKFDSETIFRSSMELGCSKNVWEHLFEVLG